jgi:hypothetical protein
MRSQTSLRRLIADRIQAGLRMPTELVYTTPEDVDTSKETVIQPGEILNAHPESAGLLESESQALNNQNLPLKCVTAKGIFSQGGKLLRYEVLEQ